MRPRREYYIHKPYSMEYVSMEYTENDLAALQLYNLEDNKQRSLGIFKRWLGK